MKRYEPKLIQVNLGDEAEILATCVAIDPREIRKYILNVGNTIGYTPVVQILSPDENQKKARYAIWPSKEEPRQRVLDHNARVLASYFLSSPVKIEIVGDLDPRRPEDSTEIVSLRERPNILELNLRQID